MVAQNFGSHLGHPLQGGAPSNAKIMMLNSTIGISTQAKNYDIPEENLSKDQPSISQPNGPLNIEKLDLDPFSHPPKGAPHQTFYNPDARASQHYNIVKALV